MIGELVEEKREESGKSATCSQKLQKLVSGPLGVILTVLIKKELPQFNSWCCLKAFSHLGGLERIPRVIWVRSRKMIPMQPRHSFRPKALKECYSMTVLNELCCLLTS